MTKATRVFDTNETNFTKGMYIVWKLYAAVLPVTHDDRAEISN